MRARFAALAARLPSYSTLNPLSAVVSFALPAALGSGVSVSYHACAFWCLLDATARSGFSRDRVPLFVSACFALYAALSVAAFWINGVGDRYVELVPLLTLLTLPFNYSVLTFARKDDMALGAVVGSMVGAYAAGLAALGQWLISGRRAEGLAGNPLVFAHVCALAGSLCLIGLLLGYSSWRGRSFAPWLAGGFAAAAAALILSGSRTYWLVFALQVLLILALGLRRVRESLSPGRVAAGGAVLAALALLAYTPVMTRFRALSRDLSRLDRDNYDTSLGLRVRLFELGKQYVQAHPWIGYGAPSSRPLVTKGLSGEYHLSRTFSHFHNGFLTAAVETGLIGLAALLCAFAALAFAAWHALRRGGGRAERFGGLMLAALLAALVVGGSFNILIGHDVLDATLMLWIILGLFLAVGTPRHPAPAAATRA